MIVTFSLPELEKQMCSIQAFHLDDHCKSSNNYEMIIGLALLGGIGIIMNFNDQRRTKIRRDTSLYHWHRPRQGLF
jgi:hypothetical protein